MKTPVLLALVILAGCRPDLGSPPSLILEPRVIAVRLDPPEVTPGGKVTAEVFAVSPQGRLAVGDVKWDLCVAPKPPAENNVVSEACVSGDGLQAAGAGPQVAVTVPLTACSLHGPDTPPTKAGEPPLRPRDPDVTGGYYQPLAVTLPAGERTFALERVGCNLPAVSLEVAQEFSKRYQPNTNPVLASLTLDGAPLAGGAEVPAGRPVALQAAWTPASHELFPVFEVGTRQIVDHHEELVISWFITAGELTRERTGHQENDDSTTVDNVWTAPTQPGPVTLWTVLRDNRGGSAIAEYHLDVR
jgi:hypothetical protein